MERFPRPAPGPLSALPQTREFPFSEREFDRARRLIYRLIGISMSDLKHDLVYGRLVRRLRATGLKSFDEYLTLVESDRGAEREAFINALTTNLTSFFRESHHFPILADHARARAGNEPYRVWCSAASTGEEPYSIAITLAEALSPGRTVDIIASDVDTQVLEVARRGAYPASRLEVVGAERIRRFFIPDNGGAPDMLRVRPELASHIRFQRINLLDPDWGLRGSFDAIFCRNVMIYFDAPTQRRVLERIHQVMRPGGLLFVGHAENFSDSRDLFALKGKTVYERQ